MEALFWGENENAFYKLNQVEPCRTLLKPFYPLTDMQFMESKNKKLKTDFPKQAGEIRIIGYDIALVGGSKNDNSIFTLMRLIPNGDHYTRHVVYMESMNGEHSTVQAIRLKQLFMDFEADYVIMDTLGNGISIYDDCCKVLYDEERDIEYPAWKANNNQNMADRALDYNALPVIYSMKASNTQINHEIAMGLRKALLKKKIKFLVNEAEGREYLTDKRNFGKKNTHEQGKMLRPYIQVTSFVNELINLEYSMSGGMIKIKEKGDNRKDRYSSVAYANYYADILEREIVVEEYDDDEELVYY